MFAPTFGHGPGRDFSNSNTRQADAFGRDDYDRYADGVVRCQAAIDFLDGKRMDPEITPAEHSEALAAIAARRGV